MKGDKEITLIYVAITIVICVFVSAQIIKANKEQANARIDDIEYESYHEGYEEGYSHGYDVGESNWYDDGYADAEHDLDYLYQVGYEDGYADARRE